MRPPRRELVLSLVSGNMIDAIAPMRSTHRERRLGVGGSGRVLRGGGSHAMRRGSRRPIAKRDLERRVLRADLFQARV